MIGDKLVITDYHREAAREVGEWLQPRLEGDPGTIAITVAGESGAGKTEIAFCLYEILEGKGKSVLILSQDDYFRLPPKSNHKRRTEDIAWVGPSEVRLDLMNDHLIALKRGLRSPLRKPLVRFQEDRIDAETIDPRPYDVVVAEGTYTSMLEAADHHVFIDRTYHQTKKARQKRARDPQTAFMERVLEIEHREIERHKERADFIIEPPMEER